MTCNNSTASLVDSRTSCHPTRCQRSLDHPPLRRLRSSKRSRSPGHIIDSLILPKVLDTITAGGGKFRIANITIGQARHDPSYAVIEVRAPTPKLMRRDPGADRRSRRRADHEAGLPARRRRHGRRVSRRLLQHDEPADRDSPRRALGRGGRPGDGLRHRRGRSRSECTNTLDSRRPHLAAARCIPMIDVRRGMQIVTGHAGVRVIPVERADGAQRFHVHVERRLDREAKGRAGPRDRPRPGDQSPRRRQDAGRRRAGDRAHRQRAAAVPADSRRLRQQAVRRQRAGDARHRAGALRHQPRRAPGRRQHRRSGPRASPAGDQPHSPLRLDSRAPSSKAC